MSRTRTLAPLALAAALLLVPAGAQAATKSVVAGPPGKPPKGTPKDFDTNAFYRKTVTVHVGDKVRWQRNGFHTITFPAKGKKPPPFISPDASSTKYAGFNDAAGVPFWFNGQNRLIFDPLGAFPVGAKSYDGSKLASAGAPLSSGRPKPYTLKFTKVGSFGYVCTIHVGMKGTVKVVAKGKAIPSAAADKKAVKAEFAKAVAQAKKADKFAGPSGNAVQAGNDAKAVSLFRFFPQKKTVPVGTTVTLSISPNTTEIHTFSFGPEAYLKQQSDGFVAPDMSVPGPPVLVFNPLVGFPSDPPPAVTAHNGANHGNGFASTGVLDRDAATPSPPSTQIRFDKAGTYEFHCLVHFDMKGQFVVE